MKGIVLAGGTGSRMYPLTKVTNKHLLPIGKEPMIFHPIKKLTEAGVTEILIVTGVEHMGAVVQLLGSGKDFGAQFTYRVQDEAGGIAQALGLAKNFVGDDSMVVLLGDNIFQDSIKEAVRKYEEKSCKGARIFIKSVEEPRRFGVAEIQGNKVLSIEEKPETPKSNFCVTGIYFYDSEVFKFIETLKPSGRGELEITDVNNAYIKQDSMEFETLKGWWTDAGTHDSYRMANNLIK